MNVDGPGKNFAVMQRSGVTRTERVLFGCIIVMQHMPHAQSTGVTSQLPLSQRVQVPLRVL